MTEDELEMVAERLAEKVLARIFAKGAGVPAGTAAALADGYPEKLSRTQAARFVGGKPFRSAAQASGTDQTLLRELRVKPILTRYHFFGRETRRRDYFSKTALTAALAARQAGR